MSYDIESELGFLARDALYDTVKPYSLRFTPPDGSPRHNLQSELTKVTIRDARPLNPIIEKHGFTLTRVPTKMRYDDFREHEKIERVYAPELQAHLKSLFQARHVRVIDYVVRRRHPDFPVSTGENYDSQQPASLVHLDFSYSEARNMLKTLYGDRAEEILQHRWQVINAWRPLRGPLFDWPLAVCDARTYSPDRDGRVSDAVYADWAYENVLVHHHPAQRWHYFSAMDEAESMLFKGADSDGAASGPCPHGAFPNQHSGGPGLPRESVESRAFVLWAPIEEFPDEVGTIYGERG